MNIEYFKKQQQSLISNVQKDFSPQPNQLMQKLDIDFEQQEKIYQSVLSKNARLEIENLKNEVAKQKQQLKEKQQQQQQNLQNQSLKENTDDSKLSNLSNEFIEDLMPPPLNLTARSIQRRDSERSARLAEAEKNKTTNDGPDNEKVEVEETSDNEQTNTDVTDEDSDEINLSPNPFTRSQFRRSFMNAVYTQKPHNLASYHASHAYCGPIDNNLEDNKTNKDDSNKNEDSNADETVPSQLTMQQRKEQLQRLLHSDPSLESDNNKLNENLDLIENKQKAVKPPRNTFKLTKDCFIKAEEKVRATPAIIVATPEKSQIIEEDEELNESISKQINQNIDQVNQVKKQLAFDLIEPMIATKPPRPTMINKKKKKAEVEQPISHENVERLNIKNRIRLIEQQQQNSSDSLSSNCSTPKEKLEEINVKNRLRSNSLTLICESKNEVKVSGSKPRHRSLSGQNLNYINIMNQRNEDESKKNLENLKDSELNYQTEKEQLNDKELLNEKEDNSPTNEDEKDNGYLTMKSELSSNDETEESQSLSPPAEKEPESKDESCEKVNQIPDNVNFDEVFSAVKSPNSDEDADDEQSLTIMTNLKSQSNQTEMEIEDDNRKTVDDQFAIYSGLSTIKKAPPNYQNTRRTKSEFKLTSALIDQQQTTFKPSLSQNSQPSSHIADQLNNLKKLNSIQQQIEQLPCSYKPQQIVSSSLINCGNLSCSFVSDPVNPEMMDANPAYETFDGILYGQSCLLPTESEESTDDKKLEELSKENKSKEEDNCKSIDESDEKINNSKLNKVEKQVLPSNGQCNAPYYYSDLLSEEQELELAKANENRPTLLSRCTNNSRNMGTTSLPKLINKKINDNQDKNDSIDQAIQASQQEIADDTNESTEALNVQSNLNHKIEDESSSIQSMNKLNDESNQNVSNELFKEHTQIIDDDPVYENVNRFNCVPQSNQSSTNLNAQNGLENETENEQPSTQALNNLTDQVNETDPEDDYLNENALRRASQNYMKQNVKVQKQTEKLNNQSNQEENKNQMLNNTATTPSKLNNTIKNPINNRTTPLHLRSPTVPGYASVDNEQPILINDDYKPMKQSSENSINTLNNNQVPNKLTWKPNLISHSSSNLNSNKLKPNNLMNYYDGSTNSLSSSLASSAQSLTNQSGDINAAANQYHRQQSAPNLTNNFINNNLFNNHGNNLNNTEKCLANKQFNLNKNINKINNLLNTPINTQDYVVYENAGAERDYLITLQKQLQQQQQLLLQQQEQLAQLQRQQLKQQHYIRNENYDHNNQPPLPAYSSSSSSSSNSLLNNNNSSSIVNESTIPFEHHLKNLQNVSIIQNEKTNSKNYHNYQNVFPNDEQS